MKIYFIEWFYRNCTLVVDRIYHSHSDEWPAVRLSKLQWYFYRRWLLIAGAMTKNQLEKRW